MSENMAASPWLRYPFSSSFKYDVSVERPITYPKGYPANPKTIGEHIQKKRLDCNLKQSEIARIIGVSDSTIWNWENRTEPDVKHLPGIIKSLVAFLLGDLSDYSPL